MRIYLAGFIQGSKIKECSEWRKEIREHYGNESYTWLDPLNGKDFATITPDGLKSSMPPHAIVHRDWQSVTSADLIIANMDTFGETRPLTGTICELAWAWEKHVPIIMITDEHKYKEHPFLKYFASWIVGTTKELIDVDAINYFKKGQENAVY